MSRLWPLGLLLLLVAAFLFRSDRMDLPPSGQRGLAAASSADGIIETTARTGEAPPIVAVTEVEPPEEAVPETEDAVLGSLRWLLNQQNPDGSWGDGPVTLDGHTLGPTGVTSLALLAYLGAGYSHLSKDTYDGKCMGDAVRCALQFLAGSPGGRTRISPTGTTGPTRCTSSTGPPAPGGRRGTRT